jgi:hypothetical protein
MSFDLDAYIKRMNRWKEARLYFWATHDGIPLHPPSQDKEEVLALKEEMQRRANEEEETISLMSYKFSERHDYVFPPPDPEEEKGFRGGGHAVGGADPHTAEEHINEMKYCFDLIYKNANQIKYWCENGNAYAEHRGIRVCISPVPEAERVRGGEHASRLDWKVTIINANYGCKFLNDPPKVKFTGFYHTGWTANQEACGEWIREQVYEEVMMTL